MALNYNRPSLIDARESLLHARDFLQHPLALTNDARLVATNELLSYRRMFLPFYTFALFSFIDTRLIKQIWRDDFQADDRLFC